MTATTPFPAIFSLLSSSGHRPTTSNSHCYPPFSPPSLFSPKLLSNQNPRLRISQKAAIYPKDYWRPRCCSGSTGINPDTTDDSSKESNINIKLPRRSLQVQFTCNACGERTKRVINRLAYERGTVFVQCSGCLQHHKLVDNLGLVVEYDFRNDTNDA